jgi:hypothetical protein
MPLLVLLSLAVGTILIRFFHRIRRAFGGSNGYFSFSDLLVEERVVEQRGFLWAALPPLFGGATVFFLPGSDALVASAAGFLAAFLGVWPVYLLPFHVLDEDLQPYWPKLRFLYLLFIGSSTGLAYLGYSAVAHLLPLTHHLLHTEAWKQFVDSLAANAMYDGLRTVVATLLVLGGVKFNKRRKEIGSAAAEAREKRRERQYNEYLEGGGSPE